MIFKYLIPFDRFVIHSPMSPTDALQALRSVVEPGKFLRFSTAGAKAFQGTVDVSGFRITRIIGYRNSFLPVIVGTVTPAPGGSLVRIHMRMIVFVMLFCCVWLTGVVSIGGNLIWRTSWAQVQAQPICLMPVGMMLFFLVLVNGGFWLEARKQKRMLTSLFTSRN
jgi:hypothetical protein